MILLTLATAIIVGRLLLSLAVTGVRLTSQMIDTPALVAGEALQNQYECVESQVHRLVPAGARLYVDVEDPHWQQRLIEFSFRHHLVVDRHREDSWTLTLMAGATTDSAARLAPACAGVEVVAEPPRT